MKILSTVSFIILTAITISFALSNDTIIHMSLWPLPNAVAMPLFLAIFIALVLGIVIAMIYNRIITLFKHNDLDKKD